MELEKRTFDFELLTEDKIKEIIKMGQAELNKRERRRREALIATFIDAWRKLEDDGGSVDVDGKRIYLDEGVEIY